MIDFISYTWQSLVRGLASSGLPNPWTEPRYFCEDIWDILVDVLEDYFLCSPIFRYGCVILLAYGILRTISYIRRDYLRFLSLGPGPFPDNIEGYLVNKWYEFFLMDVLGVDVFSEPFVGPLTDPYYGTLFNLPRREGPRPEIMGIVPTRQKPAGLPRSVDSITRLLEALAELDVRLAFRPSWATGRPALCRNLPEAPPRGTPGSVNEWCGEIAEVCLDGSMTVHLNPNDAAEVIRLGWGQRSPLAVMHESWFWVFYHHWVLGCATPLPSNAVIIYALRDGNDAVVLGDIIRAAIGWAMSQPYY